MSSHEEIETAVRQAILSTAGEQDPFSLLVDGQNPFYEAAAAAANLDVERDERKVSFLVATELGKIASASRPNPQD